MSARQMTTHESAFAWDELGAWERQEEMQIRPESGNP